MSQPTQFRENYKPYETHILASEFNSNKDLYQVTGDANAY